MIEIKPMDEGYLHLVCLHEGPVDTKTVEVPSDRAVGGHPPHPWSDETLREVAERYRTEKVYHPRPADFMVDMICRYGTCALLAWEGQKVVGHLRFYPMEIARLFVPPQDDLGPKVLSWACEPQEDEGTLWVQCVMTSRPYVGPDPDTVTGRNWLAMAEAGARKGVGLKLVRGLIDWARGHDWQRIVKIAHADVDGFYGQMGGGGKAFWEKAGFRVAKAYYFRPENWKADFVNLAEAQGREKGLTVEEVWTWYRMRYDL
jgi:GNAT superfamily N-acetyltransferase